MLVIITDQQNASMMSCTGNPNVRTPNLDSIAAQGARFERAYSTNPVCIPSRFSMMTGTMPSVIGMEHHREAGNFVAPGILASSMGTVFKQAGYHTVYAGKTHLPGQAGVLDNPKAYGFEEILASEDKEGRDPTVDACVQFLKQPQEKPFVLYASFINPHDICFLAIRAYLQRAGKPNPGFAMPALEELDRALKRPAGMSLDQFIDQMCPPLPGNYGVPTGELSAPWADKPDFMLFARQEWGEREWRLHRWAYARLTERVDGQIGRLLETLRSSSLDKNTIIVFTSDHGDQDGSHRAEHKAFLFEESARVPFVVSWAGVTKPGLVDQSHLVSSGLDLVPTVCDLAGVPIPASLRGKSVRALAEGRPVADWRDCLVVENTASRLVQMGRWKYMVGNARITPADMASIGLPSTVVRESLVDLQTDPGEMKNLAADASARPALEQGRRMLKQWYADNELALDPGYIVRETSH
ncbi:MAG: sulfatase-like hydrolase/transferase [Lacunisphaera sp.]